MITSRREGVRRLAVGVAALAFSATALAASPAPVAQAQAGTQTGATVDQTGWWSQANAVPASPVPGVTLPPLTVPAPPSVPAGTIAVGATVGQIDKVAAVDIGPEITDGVVEHAVLTIAEAPNGEQLNNTGSEAVIVACPITQFWVGGANGQWSNLPPNSCTSGKAVGARSADGVWTFDLTPIAAQWLEPGVLSPNGVVLLPEVPSPSGATFQVVLTGDPSSIGIDLAATERAPTTTAAPATTSAAAPIGGGGGGTPAPVTAAPPTSAAAATPTSAAPVRAPAPASSPRSDKILGNLPAGVILLALLALVVAVLLMVALGPLGEPATGIAREGGVSRALAARERAAADLAEPNLALEAP